MRLDEERLERIKSLGRNLSVDYLTPEGKALLDAIDCALGELFEYYSEILDTVMLKDDKSIGAKLFLEMLRERCDVSDYEESLTLIKKRLSRAFGSIKGTSLNSALENYSYQRAAGAINIQGHDAESFDEIMILSKALSNFMPPFIFYTISGSGIHFSQWDGFESSWYQLDKLDLPFCLIEQISVQE